MKIQLHSNFIGTKNHLIYDLETDELIWSNKIDNTHILFENIENEFLKLNHIQIKWMDQKYLNMIKTLKIKNPQWIELIPKEIYKENLSGLLKQLKTSYNYNDYDYYINFFKPTRAILDDLKACSIDVNQYTDYFNTSNNLILKTFCPNEDGFAKKINYNSIGGRTGRLSVSNGPQILTLKKEYRNIIKTSYDKGAIISFDYVSLEARIAAAIAGFNIETDIYQYLLEYLKLDIERKKMKAIVLNCLYGATVETISKLIFLPVEETKPLVEKIYKIFNIVDIVNNINITDNSYIRNYFNRKIKIKENEKDNIIYNSYIQSTGVDVALYGFMNIINYINNNNLKIRPLGILHDALILDIEKNEITKIEELCKIGSRIKNFDLNFLMDIEVISKRMI